MQGNDSERPIDVDETDGRTVVTADKIAGGVKEGSVTENTPYPVKKLEADLSVEKMRLTYIYAITLSVLGCLLLALPFLAKEVQQTLITGFAPLISAALGILGADRVLGRHSKNSKDE